MKVLNVNMSIDPVSGGGTAERTFQLSRTLARLGIDCSLLTTDVGLTSERRAALSGVKLHALSCLNRRFYIPAVSLTEIYRIVESVDIVHLMSHWTLINALVYHAARKFNKPYVLCPAGELVIYGRSKIFKRVFNYFVGKKILKNANGYITITEKEIELFRHYMVDESKITIIPNGINPDDFATYDNCYIRRKYKLGANPFVLFVGRLHPIKGPDLLLQAFASLASEFPNYHLVFVGPDQGMLDELMKTARKTGVDNRIHFIGYLGGEEKSMIYHAADILVIPSRQEAMSIVALEAGIAATPVLLTDQCGFDEVAIVGGGEVVSATVKGIHYGLDNLLKQRSSFHDMGHCLQHYVSSNYTWDATAKQYIELYQRLLS
ncbi:D-inositol-3-phosphate glycosyltransferase [Sporomusa silvacetica DSM 10669]|uniref:D-inositol-3-phosphate glycosyltransferase n=1 Tax=Sporomusa silvacetica DSM 10669 TaxID=1123289 RepID=A0ABZ3IR73_9FIRM|nr:glycosyltransferase [Sporomusa silvacetica]OZC20537.1 D-inositol 3-phosphate glycosyltransferase [Sporomusa silvacetica DSM 10669]